MTKVNSQKYSKALLEVAQEKGQLEAILAEVSEMIQLFKEDDLATFLSSEVYSFSAKSELIDKTCIHKGNINKIVVDPRLIFAKALEKKATSIVLAHNHPSGDSNPSKDDIRLTNDLKKIGDLMQIKLADHVIMSSTTNFSFYLHDLI